MTIIADVGRALVLLMFAVVTNDALAAHRTFVASKGNDANPCSLVFPCRSFAAAVALTDPGGEVVALDSAGYGQLVITKAITVAGPPGVQASITGSSGFGAVYVGAGPTDRVVLRGLDVTSTGSVTRGIAIFSAGEVVIEDCIVSGSEGGVALAGPGLLTMSRSRVVAAFNKTAFEASGILGEARFVIEDSRLQVSGNGGGQAVIAHDMVNGTIRNSELLGSTGFGSYGVRAQGDVGKLPSIAIQGSLISGHNYGIYADGSGTAFGANVSVTNSDVSHNVTGVVATSGGTIALSSSQVGFNVYGVEVQGTSLVFTDGRNFFGYNQNDLFGSTVLTGPIGIR